MLGNTVLFDLVAKQKSGIAVGIPSICSANEMVIEVALECGLGSKSPVLIESTSNQVNQFGGYTGYTPFDFKERVLEIAERVGFPAEKVLLGGDHLGPNPWRNEPSELAMHKAGVMIGEYVKAGFSKIHLDASMPLGGEDIAGLTPDVIAQRTATLCTWAENAYQERLTTNPRAYPPVFVIGTEVPAPGGAGQENEIMEVTKPEALHETVELTRAAFLKLGLHAAWERVIAVVVQPGVDFDDQLVYAYDRTKALALVSQLKRYEQLVFEGHSTDYQLPAHLRELVEDGVGILKVGPELTFAYREALFQLSYLEEELLAGGEKKTSDLRNTLETAMLASPDFWLPYYSGTPSEMRLARRYGLSDRARYYWNIDVVRASVERLMSNLAGISIPLALISQYFPLQYEAMRTKKGDINSRHLVKNHIAQVTRKYYRAANWENLCGFK